MSTVQTQTKEVTVRDLKEVAFCVINTLNDLQIRQGEQESLVIEAAPNVLARLDTRVSNGRLEVRLEGGWWDRVREALSTSLSRPLIRFRLQVRDLKHLELCGLFRVRATDLSLDHLTLDLQGPMDVKVEALTAHTLTVQKLTVGSVELSGEVAEQRVRVSGMGRYQAAHLKSQRAAVVLQGPSRASLWVIDELDADVRGPGSVEYRGRPRVRRRLAPLGRVAPLGVH
jgi:hypothetical protein